MNFFSGFGFCHEESLFSAYLDDSDYTVSGFSLGAIEATLYVLETQNRIDKLQLFSPAFFHNQSDAFKRAQLHYFQKDKERYSKTFMQNVAYPSQKDLSPYRCETSVEALEKLLYFQWQERDLQKIIDRGIEIEVYLGGRDKIIDASKAKAYFLPYATIYFIKEGGHCLWTKSE